MPKNASVPNVAVHRISAAMPSGVASLALLFCVASKAIAQDIAAPIGVIHYAVEPLIGINGVNALEVKVRFVGNSQGQSIFELPSDTIGGHERWTYLSHFQGRGVRIIANEKEKRIFLYRPGATVTVTYRVRSAYSESPTSGDFFAVPMMLPSWLATLGEFIFVVPEHGKTVPITFDWKSGPGHWACLSNLDRPSAEEPLTVARLLESSIIAGPRLKVVERPIFGGVLRLAAVGSWKIPIDRDADLVAKIVSAQRAFWGDMTGPFTVMMVALAGPGQGGAGVGRYRGFIHYVSESIPPAQYIREVAHEHIHSWIPGRLGEMPEGNNEAVLYWFSEGFTEFYTQRTLLRTGIWSLKDFITDLNDTLALYAANPNNGRANDWTSTRFWTDPTVQRIPYLRGNLFAYLLDQQIRQRSGDTIGLNQVIFRMRDRWMRAPIDHRPGVLENLKASYRDVLGSDDQLDALIESHITKGAFIQLPIDMFGRCATVEPSVLPYEDGPQTVRLPAMDEQQAVTCAQMLP
jgi:predicted metalloprotease with PDZ domain